jgi:hypothetical protein
MLVKVDDNDAEIYLSGTTPCSSTYIVEISRSGFAKALETIGEFIESVGIDRVHCEP